MANIIYLLWSPSSGLHDHLRHRHDTMISIIMISIIEVGGQAVLGRQHLKPTPWLTKRHGYDPILNDMATVRL